MKILLISTLLTVATAPAFAVVVAPAPEIGFGLPSIVAAIAVGAIVLLVRRKRSTH